jgi:hypothetical protein
LCFKIGYVGSESDSWLWDILHVFFCGVHIVYVAYWRGAAISHGMAWFSTVEAGAFGSRSAQQFLGLCSRHICVLGGCHICIHVVALILSAVVGCLGSG